jgi:hypothetical protein
MERAVVGWGLYARVSVVVDAADIEIAAADGRARSSPIVGR